MEPKIAAIPTVYNGAQFRSRLEATWAAFFDLVGWKWTYEPVDLEGWTPDFVLSFEYPIKRDFYAEVKPVTAGEFYSLPGDPFEKAFVHWQEVHVLKLGIGPSRAAHFLGIGGLCDCPEGRHEDWDEMNQMLCVNDAEKIWRKAQAVTQWRGKQNKSAYVEIRE